jgi:hypothetical protein
LNTDQKTIEDWDVYTNISTINYMYKSPLCYQLFQQTENRKYWFYVPLFSELYEFLIYILKLDKHLEPGYSFFYNFFSHIFLFLIIFIVLFFIYKFNQ